jgi:hypothetical protein
MERVSGAYKRWAQLLSFLFALGFAILLNISTIDVARSLWRQPVDIKAISATTDQTKLPAILDRLESLPIGWPASVDWTGATGAVAVAGATTEEPQTLKTFFYRYPSEWDWTHIAGWVITAFATLFGAPFWV